MKISTKNNKNKILNKILTFKSLSFKRILDKSDLDIEAFKTLRLLKCV